MYSVNGSLPSSKEDTMQYIIWAIHRMNRNKWVKNNFCEVYKDEEKKMKTLKNATIKQNVWNE